MRLLITRPEPDGEGTAEKLRARGFEVLLAPLLQVEIVDAGLADGPWDALVITSTNALGALAQHPRRSEMLRLPVLAVGRRTADAARAAGFTDVTSADGDVKDLVRVIRARYRGRAARVLYLAGEDRRGDLARALATDGVEVKTVVVYRAVKAARFPPLIQEALATGRLDGVLHFSRRSAEAYIDCAKAGRVLDRALAPAHYCLSPHVAEPLSSAGAARIGIAPRPEEGALIDLVAP